MSKGAAQPQEHAGAALRMARAELLQNVKKEKRNLAALEKNLSIKYYYLLVKNRLKEC